MTTPALFIGHGSPLTTLGDNPYTRAWADLGARVGKPKAVLAISAHWWIDETAVTAMERPRTIHDFGGFPQALFDIRYPASGSPDLAGRVANLLAPTVVRRDLDWGLDHGIWAPLRHVLPDADVPVVQLSLDATRDPAWHYEQAKRLRPLRDEGVLIVGSGDIVHNLRTARREPDAPAYPWAENFSHDIKAALRAGDHAAVVDYGRFGEAAALAVADIEHFLPLLYVAAMQDRDEPLTFLTETIEMGSIDMTSFAVGL